jgi:Ran GTPase-activating protein (RanGAP) involved in mRNA processing and transport
MVDLMEYFEYKVIPAPRRSVRIKGAKGVDGKFAATLEKTINDLAAGGWQYLRAESLPIDERHGITRRKTETYQNVLIFCRPTDGAAAEDPVVALLEDTHDDKNLFDDDEDTSEQETVADAEDTDADTEVETEAEEAADKKNKAKKGKKA